MKALSNRGSRFCAAAFALVLLAGCGPKVIRRPEFNDQALTKVAFLPPVYPSGVQKERIDYIRSAFASEVQGNGLVMLDDRIVAHNCSTPECPERKDLAGEYGVTSFLQLKVDSISRNNFIAGYYNTIKGSVSLTDSNARELFRIDHTESERGGLIFESGQLIEGVIQTVKNASADESVSNLSSKFVRSLVQQFPSRAQATQENVYALNVKSVEVKEKTPELYEVCADATPHSLAALIVNKRSSTLRETKEGHYCGIYDLTSLQSGGSNITLEVRSAFGNVARRDVDLGNVSPCDLKGHVQLAEEKGKPEVRIVCTQTATVKGEDQECPSGVQRCIDTRFLVYKGNSKLGPFEKVATITGTTWKDSAPASQGKGAFYQVVALSKKGVRSQPVAPSTEENNKETK